MRPDKCNDVSKAMNRNVSLNTCPCQNTSISGQLKPRKNEIKNRQICGLSERCKKMKIR